MVQDRIQTWLDLNVANPRTGKVTRLIHESSPTWVNRLPEPHWLEDGTFLWMSERTGYRHIYHYRKNGELIRAVTEGPWAVGSRLLRLDEEKGLVWYTSTKDGAIDSNLYRSSISGGA